MVGAVSVCLSSEGERKILLVFQFHRILLNITLSDSDFEVREGRKGWMEGVGLILEWPPR